jgi:cyclopropane-fatty-acyl-phospholipid synthase
MKTVSIASPESLASSAKPRRLDRLARRLFRSRLERLVRGRIVIHDGVAKSVYGTPSEDCPLEAVVHVHDPRFYSDLVFGGSIGSGEAYMQGHWTCDDLSTLVRILLINRNVLEHVDSGAVSLARPARKLLHWLNRNTRSGSRRNIAAHYDLGNDFYALWLDPRMMYSSAYFESPEVSLDEAAAAKLDMICRKLDLQPGDRLLEIGSGWGGFAIFAARNYGCHVTTTTISREQYAFAEARIREAGLEDRITLLAEDYRDLSGHYDKLVSIEMIEAVGHQFHTTFFRKCCDLLEPHGKMLLQAITIADQRFDAYKKDVDFIRRYIFPGGCLTSVTNMCEILTEHTDMRVLDLEDIGPHYAHTLRIWRERFFAAIDQVRDLGYSEPFIRMWDYYLCFCEGAFEERAIGDVQMLITRPEAR